MGGLASCLITVSNEYGIHFVFLTLEEAQLATDPDWTPTQSATPPPPHLSALVSRCDEHNERWKFRCPNNLQGLEKGKRKEEKEKK
jgi:hypothetical protein